MPKLSVFNTTIIINMRLFGKKKKKPMKPEDTLKTIEGLRKTADDIAKRSNLLQNKAQSELKQALERKKNGDKNGALVCLKRKKMYETEIAKLEGSRMNLEQQLFAIEGASMNKNIFDSLKQGNQALKDMHGEINIDEVDKLKDEMEDQQDLLNELNEAISQPVGVIGTMDDDELMDELNELEAEEYEKSMLEVSEPSATVPKRQVVEEVSQPQPAAKQDAELDELFDSMEMT